MPRLIVPALVATLALAAPASAATLLGGNGSDRIEGTHVSDDIRSGGGSDTVHGRAGDDAISGDSGDDRLWGDDGGDVVLGGTGADEAHGGDADDRLSGDSGSDRLSGDDGNDTAYGASGDDLLEGGPGHDTLAGDTGNDTIRGGAGLDAVYLSSGRDSADGGPDNDLLIALDRAGSHTLLGGWGHDILAGAGPLRGGDGDDLLLGSGHGSIDGGAGNDTCVRAPNVVLLGCETEILQSADPSTPMLEMTSGPSENAVLEQGAVSINFTSRASPRAWCLTEARGPVDCSSGFYQVQGLAPGRHAVAIVAAARGVGTPAVLVRHFTVAAMPTPVLTGFSSPTPDVVAVSGDYLVGVDTFRLTTADGQVLAYRATDTRVSLSSDSNTYLITDVRLGRETVTLVEAMTKGDTVASRAGAVGVATTISLLGASSTKPSSIVVAGTHLNAVDAIDLIHDGGSIRVSIPGPDVVVTGDQLIISSAALDGLRLTQVDALRLIDGAEVMASIGVDLYVAGADVSAPALDVPAALTVEAQSAMGAVATFQTAAIDDHDGPLTVECSAPSGSTFPLGMSTVACQATDTAGNTARAVITVLVTDTTGPALQLPEELVVESQDPSGSSVSYSVSATDLVDGSRPVECAPPSGDRFAFGTTLVTCEAADRQGNTSAAAFSVSVRDTVGPSLLLTTSPDVTVGDETGEAVPFHVSAVDEVDGALPASCDPADGAVLAAGSYAVHCSAVDGSGNVGVLNFTLNVSYVEPYGRVDDLVDAYHPVILTEGYRENLPEGRVMARPEADLVVSEIVDPVEGAKLVYSEGNLGYEDNRGEVHAIDTTLEANAAGYAPRSVEHRLQLPRFYRDGIKWALQDGTAMVTAPVATSSLVRAGRASSDHVVYPDAWPSTDVIDTATEGGLKEHLLISSSAAPLYYEWRVSHPERVSLSVQRSGIYLATGDDAPVLVTHPPTAWDGAGQAVAASYEVRPSSGGSTITLRWSRVAEDADGRQQPIVYPVDLDPSDEHAAVQQLPVYGGAPGIVTGCTTSSFVTYFNAGHTYQPNAFGGCEFPEPPLGSSWERLQGDMAWGMDRQKIVSLKDEYSNAPRDSAGRDLRSLMVDQAATLPMGSSHVNWVKPVGGVQWAMTQSEQKAQTNEQASSFKNIVRTMSDLGKPQIIETTPAAGTAWRPAASYDLGISGSDIGSGCKGGFVSYRSASVPVVTHPYGGCWYSTPVPFHATGIYTLRYALEDNSGNVSTAGHDLKIDATPPPNLRTPLFLILNEEPESASVYASWNGVVDAQAGIDQYEWCVVPASSTACGQATRVSGSTNGTTDAATGVSLLGVTMARACVRAKDRVGLASAYACSKATPVPGSGGTAPELDAPPSSPAARGDATASVPLLRGFRVEPMIGAVSGSFTDVDVDAGLVDLSIRRTYRSVGGELGVLGRGWMLDFERRVNLLGETPYSYLDETGSAVSLEERSPGVWAPASDSDLDWEIRTDGDGDTVLTRPNGTSDRHDPDGRLEQTCSSGGHCLRYHRDAEGRVARIQSPSGLSLTLSYDGNGHLHSVADPAGRTTVYSRPYVGTDAEGSPVHGPLALVSAPGVSPVAYRYEEAEPFRLTGIAIEDSESWAELRYTPGAEEHSKLEAVTDGESEQTFDYATDAFEVRVMSPNRSILNRVRFKLRAGRFTSVAPDGEAPTTAAYDSMGRPTETAIVGAPSRKLTWSAEGWLTSYTDEEGRTTRYGDFTSSGMPRSITNNAQRTIRYAYNSDSLPTLIDMPSGRQLRISWRADGCLLAISDSRRRDIAYKCDAHGRTTAQTTIDGTTELALNANGEILEERDPKGSVWKFGRDEAGRISRVTDPEGHFEEYEYRADGLLTSHSDARQHRTRYHYDKSGRLIEIVDPLQRSYRYHYDAAGTLDRFTDANGAETGLSFTPAGRLMSLTEPGNLTTSFTNNIAGMPATMTLPHVEGQPSATYRFSYDDLGNLASAQNPEERLWSLLRDDNGALRSIRTPRQGAWDLGRNEDADATSVKAPDQDAVTVGHDAAGMLETITTPMDRVTQFTRDAEGRVKAEIRPSTNSVSYEYDASGNLKRMIDERNKITIYEHDKIGQLTREISPSNRVTAWKYDPNGNVREMTDSAGTWKQEFDDVDRLTKLIRPDGTYRSYQWDEGAGAATVDKVTRWDDCDQSDYCTRWSTYKYDAAQRLTEVVRSDSDPRQTSYTYDARGNVTSISKDGELVEYTYDGNGNVASSTNSRGRTNFSWDDDDNLIAKSGVAGIASYKWDRAGRLTEVNEAHAGVTRYEYNADGLLHAITTAAGTPEQLVEERGYNADGWLSSVQVHGEPAVLYERDVDGRPLSVTDASGVTRYGYDDDGFITAVTAPGGGSIGYHRNAKDAVDGYTINGAAFAMPRDASGRPTEITGGDGRLGLSYRTDGLVDQISRGNGIQTSFSYNGTETTDIDETGGVLRNHISDDEGRIWVENAQVHGQEHQQVVYAYDPRGRLHRAASPWVSLQYRYTREGQLHRVTFHVDVDGAVLPESSEARDVEFARCFASGSDGQECAPQTYQLIHGLFAAGEGALLRRDLQDFSHEEKELLGFIKRRSGASGISYKDFGSVAGLAPDAISQRGSAAVPDANRRRSSLNECCFYLSEIGQFDYKYDSTGSVTEERQLINAAVGDTNKFVSAAFRYDSQRRLRQWSRSGQTASYHYTDQGRISSVVTATHRDRYTYHQGGALAGIYDGSTAQWMALVHGPSGILGFVVDGAMYYFHFDIRGSVVAISDSAGSRVVKYEYGPWGDSVATGDPALIDLNPLRYLGRDGVVWRPELAAYLMGPRVYRPDLYRFLQADPVSPDGTQASDAYLYAGADPINNMDPDGRSWTSIFQGAKDTLVDAVTDGAGAVKKGVCWAVEHVSGNGNACEDMEAAATHRVDQATRGVSDATTAMRQSAGQLWSASKHHAVLLGRHGSSSVARAKRAAAEARRKADIAEAKAKAAADKFLAPAYAAMDATKRLGPVLQYAARSASPVAQRVAGHSINAFAGVVDGVTGGASTHLINGLTSSLGLPNLIDSSSKVFRTSSLIGTGGSFFVAPQLAVLKFGGRGLRAVRAVGVETSATRGASRAGGALQPATSCRINSFVGPTLVSMANGTRRPISLVRPGDLVAAWDSTRRQVVSRRVEKVWSHPEEGALRRVVTPHGSFVATSGHPIWSETSHVWTRAELLEPGDQLLSARGTAVSVLSNLTEPAFGRIVYNLTVEANHNYYIDPGTSTLLVHNCGYRQALARYTGSDAGPAYHAHHRLPRQFGQELWDEFKIDVDDPRFLRWVKVQEHRIIHRAGYNRAFREMLENGATADDIVEFGLAPYTGLVR